MLSPDGDPVVCRGSLSKAGRAQPWAYSSDDTATITELKHTWIGIDHLGTPSRNWAIPTRACTTMMPTRAHPVFCTPVENG